MNDSELEQPAANFGVEIDAAATDRFTSLPDDLRVHILGFLSTESAVQTSVLSQKWKSTWKDTSMLRFRSDTFKSYSRFRTFVRKVISLRNTIPLKWVEFRDNQYSEIRHFLLFRKLVNYAQRHGAAHLGFHLYENGQESCFLSDIFRTDGSNWNLESLFLRLVAIDIQLAPPPGGFPMLKRLILSKCTICVGKKNGGKFDPFSGLACLKFLFLIRCDIMSLSDDNDDSNFIISGAELDSLTVDVRGSVNVGIGIYAPKLKLLTMRHDLESLKLTNWSIPTLEAADIRIYNVRNLMEDDKERTEQNLMLFFQRLNAATTILLQSTTIEILSCIDSFLEQQPSPFTRLKTLAADEEPRLRQP